MRMQAPCVVWHLKGTHFDEVNGHLDDVMDCVSIMVNGAVVRHKQGIQQRGICHHRTNNLQREDALPWCPVTGLDSDQLACCDMIRARLMRLFELPWPHQIKAEHIVTSTQQHLHAYQQVRLYMLVDCRLDCTCLPSTPAAAVPAVQAPCLA